MFSDVCIRIDYSFDNLFCKSITVRNMLRKIFSVYNVLCNSLICMVWVGINQSQTRIVKNIINSENCYVIYLLCIIDIKKISY